MKKFARRSVPAKGLRHRNRCPRRVAVSEGSWLCCKRRSNPRDAQPNAIKSRPCTQIQSLPVIIAPGKVVRMLRPGDGPQVFAFGRNDPKATGSGNVKVSVL